MLRAIELAESLRFGQPAAHAGNLARTGVAAAGRRECADATARANIDLLWRCFDGLPDGEPDLLGPALDAALDQLKALPDPEADNHYGVQLMTIHKAKGLEFEVVIVPDLQAGAGSGKA